MDIEHEVFMMDNFMKEKGFSLDSAIQSATEGIHTPEVVIMMEEFKRRVDLEQELEKNFSINRDFLTGMESKFKGETP